MAQKKTSASTKKAPAEKSTKTSAKASSAKSSSSRSRKAAAAKKFLAEAAVVRIGGEEGGLVVAEVA